ncbi:MAG TPA: PfkB family carbohydrate kinase [Myxococcales bacterium]|nr:PfkB family carbohydrate kinase [Myxococcales bacterium]
MILIAGHYCHDVLIAPDGSSTQALGGSASYGSAILDAFGEPYEVAAKVGADFRYFEQVSRKPLVVAGKTTSFVDDYRSGERVERVSAVCEPLTVLPPGPFKAGLAFGVAGEVPLTILAQLRERCDLVLADAQSLLRFVDSGDIRLRPLDPEAVQHLDYLKASRKEAALLDVPALRRRLKLILTDGPRGCTLLTVTSELHLPALPAVERDPTGAGDCFLAGFALGLARGYSEDRALRLASWCGARAVEHPGVPRLIDTEREEPG